MLSTTSLYVTNGDHFTSDEYWTKMYNNREMTNKDNLDKLLRRFGDYMRSEARMDIWHSSIWNKITGKMPSEEIFAHLEIAETKKKTRLMTTESPCDSRDMNLFNITINNLNQYVIFQSFLKGKRGMEALYAIANIDGDSNRGADVTFRIIEDIAYQNPDVL